MNPPMGFTSHDWSEEIKSDEPTSNGPSKPDEVALKEDLHLRGPIPIPISIHGDKTLDWSRPVENEGLVHDSVYLNPVLHCE